VLNRHFCLIFLHFSFSRLLCSGLSIAPSAGCCCIIISKTPLPELSTSFSCPKPQQFSFTPLRHSLICTQLACGGLLASTPIYPSCLRQPGQRLHASTPSTPLPARRPVPVAIAHRHCRLHLNIVAVHPDPTAVPLSASRRTTPWSSRLWIQRTPEQSTCTFSHAHTTHPPTAPRSHRVRSCWHNSRLTFLWPVPTTFPPLPWFGKRSHLDYFPLNIRQPIHTVKKQGL
jgi:hypothetical protein